MKLLAFSNISVETTGQIKVISVLEPLSCKNKTYKTDICHMTKIATMLLYGISFKKIPP